MSVPGASELMRSLGLLVDGPAAWGRPVSGRGPGVFVVELPAAPETAPIDEQALQRWLARVPRLTLDGERPTARQLARRLASFWLPGEPILYVGRSRKSVGARVAAMHATVLGEGRSNPAGHWLKALSAPSELRIWWAATDAVEEYEDELLAQVARRQSATVLAGLPDASIVLPFANVATAAGDVKVHGIANAWLETPATPSQKQPAAAVPASGRTVAPAGASRTAQPRPAARRLPVPASSSLPPAAQPTYLSASGIAELQSELDHLRATVRPAVIERVKTARELGDLRENADYEAARNEQSFLEGRIQALEATLRAVIVVDPRAAGDVVVIGSTVVVEVDGETVEWRLVGSSEADPAAGRISYGSPVGQALLGRRAGDEVVAQLPRGQLQLRVSAVR